MIKRAIIATAFVLLLFGTATAAEKSVLILYYKTDFKSLVKNRIIEKFDKTTTRITVAELKTWKMHPVDKYDAVILLSGVMAGNPYKDGAEYIKTNNYSKKIIYFSSSEKKKAAFGSRIDQSKIDVITSASKEPQAAKAADSIYRKTLEVLK